MRSSQIVAAVVVALGLAGCSNGVSDGSADPASSGRAAAPPVASSGVDPQILSDVVAGAFPVPDDSIRRTMRVRQAARSELNVACGGQALDINSTAGRYDQTVYADVDLIAQKGLVEQAAEERPGAAGAVGRFSLAALDAEGRLDLVDVTAPDGARLRGNVVDDLRVLGIAMGGFIGLVGLFSVANTLTMAVGQRAREIGLRAAIGWGRARIASLILVESLLAGVIAGVLGCAIGMLAAGSWCAVQGWDLIVAPWLPVVMVASAVVASLVGGLLPAHRAASISPLVAMRS